MSFFFLLFPSNKVVRRHPLKSEPSLNSLPRVNRSTTGNRAVGLYSANSLFKSNHLKLDFCHTEQWINPHPLTPPAAQPQPKLTFGYLSKESKYTSEYSDVNSIKLMIGV
jgi:hypothetical protein